MQIFADTADVEAIREAHEWGFIDGVTTNPALVAETDRSYRDIVTDLDEFVQGPINAQVVATDEDGMVEQGRKYDTWSDNIAVKIPVTQEGIKAIDRLSDEGIKTNATCLFSPVQALVAAKNGASYVSTWWGTVNDSGHDGYELVRNTREILDQYGYDTEIIVASVRDTRHIVKSARIGADIITVPPWVFGMLWDNPLTNQSLDNILSEWGDRGDPTVDPS
ncbi:transaldolase family protein [Halorubrum vacuolatum]|nr:transaldolase family protein [Halorubrum vacuolatum]